MNLTNLTTTLLPGNATAVPPRGSSRCTTLPDTALQLSMKTSAIVVVLLMALIGNLMVVAVIKRNSRLRTTVNYLILNMAICELLVPIAALPRRISRLYFPRGQILVDGILGSLFCKVPYFSENLSAAVSMQSLVLLAVERCHAVVYPFKLPLISNRARIVLIPLTWILGAAASSANLHTYRLWKFGPNVYCIYTWEPSFRTLTAFKYELVSFFVIFIGLPFVVTSWCYAVIICTLNREKTSTQLATQERERRAKENRQITFMSILVLIVFLIAWVPSITYLFIFTFSWNFKHKCGLESFQFASDFLTFTYPAVNPIIYYVFNQNFRRGFKELLCGQSKCFCFRSLRVSSRAQFDSTTNHSNAATVNIP